MTSKRPQRRTRRTRRYRLTPATVLRLKPGDTVAITIPPQSISVDQYDRMRRHFLTTLDPQGRLGLRILLLSADMAVSILRSEGLD